MKINVVVSFFVLVLLSGCVTSYSKIDNGENVKVARNAKWNMHEDVLVSDVVAKKVPESMASLVFLRSQDDDGKQTGANIAINSRFQVSLQPNNYTQVFSCAGENSISVVITGEKTNNLLKDAQVYTLAPTEIYFFSVDVDNQTGEVSLMQINKQTAEKALANKTYQTHQISRVTTKNCAKPLIKMNKPLSLHVEFDFDKATIRPAYNARLQAVAQFLTAQPSAVVLIEGHTDNKGSVQYNQGLSERRARAVKQELMTKYGVDASRIESRGFGELSPIATNRTDEGRQRNRRVDALIIAKNN